MLDGELVAVRPDGFTSFPDLQAALSAGADGSLIFYAFDLLALDGWDLRGCRLLDRKRLLHGIRWARSGIGALHVGYYDPAGQLHYAGGVGTGFSDRVLTEWRTEVLSRLRCAKCRRPPAPVYLCAGHRENNNGAPADWAIELVPQPPAATD